jgi:NADPH:quinone reductase-like Zn-dependent oxidoreductase
VWTCTCATTGALTVGRLTAWRMLFGKRALRAGETVLLVGIGSGVAVAALHLALQAGAQFGKLLITTELRNPVSDDRFSPPI